LFSDAALMLWVGFKAHQIHQGICQRGASTRQGERLPGPICRDCQANPIHAVVVRKWQGKGYGPGGTTVLLTHASVAKPLQAFDDDDDCRLMEHCGLNEAKQPWDLGHPPQNTAWVVRVPVVFTRLMCALATAYRRPCEHEARGEEPVDWQRLRTAS
jgi:hypothetical protein